MNYAYLKPISDNTGVLDSFVDQTMSDEMLIVEISDERTVNVYDLKEEFFGLRLITNNEKDPISLFPIYDASGAYQSILKGISEREEEVEAIRSISLLNAYLNTFALDHVFFRKETSYLLGQQKLFGFSGLAYSIERQLNPPSIKQQDGTIVTTKGSSIFYHTPNRPLNDYVYQFKVEGLKSIFWNDYIEIVQIKTTLFKQKDQNIEFYLYATERVFQGGYFPKIGDDIMGIMQLSTQLY